MVINKDMSNILKFPAKRFKNSRKIKTPNLDYYKLAEDMSFADQLTESLIVQLVHALGDNGIKVTDKDLNHKGWE